MRGTEDTARRILLVQHGAAKPESEDPKRPLTEAGAAEVERMAIWAARIGISPAQIRHIGKPQARDTAAILAEPLAPSEGTVAISGLSPGDDVRPWQWLCETSRDA